MRRLLLGIVLVTCVGLAVVGYHSIQSQYQPHGQLAVHFSSLEELVAATPTVITGKVAKDSEEFVYLDVTFVRTEIKVKDVLRDSAGLKTGDVITLLQTKMDEDPIVSKSDELLLFVRKYEGPVIDDAYVLRGSHQGHFKTKDGKIYPKKGKESGFAAVSISELEGLLDKVDYVPWVRPNLREKESRSTP